MGTQKTYQMHGFTVTTIEECDIWQAQAKKENGILVCTAYGLSQEEAMVNVLNRSTMLPKLGE